MDKEQVIDIVRAFKEAIAPKYKNAKVYLYGSYSKGTATADSDIDVAVIVPHLQGDWFSIVPPLWTQARQVSSLISFFSSSNILKDSVVPSEKASNTSEVEPSIAFT